MELNLVIFTHVLVSLSKAQAEFLENLFPPRAQTGGENYDLHIKIKSENIKVTWNISLFIFCMICNFYDSM